MKKSLFALLSAALLLTACQSGPQMLPSAALNPQLRAPQLNQLRSASTARPQARSGGTRWYSMDEYRNFLAGKLLATLDKDADQALNPQEFSRLVNKAVVARFSEVDGNRDGRLNLAELQAGKNAVFSERYSEANLRNALTKFFQGKDLNRDQKVSFQESGSMINFIFDYDGDQNFSVEEFIDAISQMLSMSPEKTNEFLKEHLG
ncbi:MAG: EF-hand domain-containing protein [Candidatus Sericytochromatia bacterium]